MDNFAIIAIGYNRVDSIKRLLESIEKADYDNSETTLIISIDNSGSDSVECFANEFVWSHGKKIIKTYPERLGLRKHVLTCGSYVKDYDAVIILEDDLIVSPGYYQYVKSTYEKYHDDSNIAGISLYNYEWNENVCLPFSPALSKYDVYFIKMSQSWGQVWFKNQWKDFIEWYEQNMTCELANDNIPRLVTDWPDSSWKKYHIKYCIEKNKYMVFPYKSLTTCYSEVGEHCKKMHTYLQVPILDGVKIDYDLPDFNEEDVVKYDAFFERILEKQYNDTCVDLYGSKMSYEGKRYLLSTRNLPYRLIKSYGMLLKPQEQNILFDVSGNEIFLYDLHEKDAEKKVDNALSIFRYRYNLYDKVKMLSKCIIDSLSDRIRKK